MVEKHHGGMLGPTSLVELVPVSLADTQQRQTGVENRGIHGFVNVGDRCLDGVGGDLDTMQTMDRRVPNHADVLAQRVGTIDFGGDRVGGGPTAAAAAAAAAAAGGGGGLLIGVRRSTLFQNFHGILICNFQIQTETPSPWRCVGEV